MPIIVQLTQRFKLVRHTAKEDNETLIKAFISCAVISNSVFNVVNS